MLFNTMNAHNVYSNNYIDILYLTTSNKNIIDVDMTSKNIKIFYYINNEKIYFYNNKLDYPFGYFIWKEKDSCNTYLRLFFNVEYRGFYITTIYIEIKTKFNNFIDKFEYEFSKNDIVKIWYNENIIWDISETSKDSSIVTIHK